MNVQSLYRNVALLPRRIRQRDGWIAVPTDDSLRAAVLAHLPRFCRQALRRMGFTLPVVEASFGGVTHGKTYTGLEFLAEVVRNVGPGSKIFFTDGTSSAVSAAHFAKVHPFRRRLVFRRASKPTRILEP